MFRNALKNEQWKYRDYSIYFFTYEIATFGFYTNSVRRKNSQNLTYFLLKFCSQCPIYLQASLEATKHPRFLKTKACSLFLLLLLKIVSSVFSLILLTFWKKAPQKRALNLDTVLHVCMSIAASKHFL